MQQFARDVFVNVLANLIAASVIYLLGVTVGILPKSRYLILTSVVFVFMAAGLALAVVSQLRPRGPNRRMLFGVSLLLVGPPGMLMPLIDKSLNSFDRAFYPFMGVLCIFQGVVFILIARRRR